MFDFVCQELLGNVPYQWVSRVTISEEGADRKQYLRDELISVESTELRGAVKGR